MLNQEEIHATSLLNALPALGPRRLRTLIEKFRSADEAVRQRKLWHDPLLMESDVYERLQDQWDEAGRMADLDMAFIQKGSVSVYLAHEGPYPVLLKEISVVPPIIYAQGQPLDDTDPAVALVGSRRCSYYGERVAKKLAAELVGYGVVTVSGLARGIDTFIHQATMEEGGRTIAVIGSGLASLYPPENEKLADKIMERGSVISEFPTAATPLPQNFPRRNRIIAGLSLATVLIEGGPTSGALITARLAAEEGRDVFAVPNPIGSPFSIAPHRLLKEGAGLVESGDEICQELGIGGRVLNGDTHAEEKNKSISSVYAGLLTVLAGDIMHRDQLAHRLKMKSDQVSRMLVEMELKGLIKVEAGGYVSKV